jgi:hypothetical protein
VKKKYGGWEKKFSNVGKNNPNIIEIKVRPKWPI